MTNNLPTINALFKELCYHIGLGSFTIESYYEPTNNNIAINFRKSLQDISYVSDDPQTIIEKYFKPLLKDIENSEAVQNAKFELTSENEKLKETQLKLQEEIQRLKPFEEYYNLALKMQHGEK
jgi:hypothetical protein